MIDLAIVASAIPARVPLLLRSMGTWLRSAEASKLNVAIRVYGEGGCKLYSKRDRFSYTDNIEFHDEEEKSGSHIAGYNYWLERVDAKVYLFTHPDILFPSNTVEVAYKLAIPNRFVAFKVFWIPEQMTEELDRYNWREPETLEKEKDLFPAVDFADGHGTFYWNSDVRNKKEWHSTTTFAVDSELAHKIYPMPDLHHQGYDDPLHYQVRYLLGVEEYTVANPILFHQHHSQTWDQNTQQAIQEAIQLRDEYYIPLFKEKGWI